MTPNPILGVLLHAIGAMSAAFCYTPQKKTRSWSWQTYWLAQASVCWLILPSAVAWLTIPDLAAVLKEAPSRPMLISFALGALYGIGGTAFGLAIRHIGFSLTYAIAIGISCVMGTLLPPLLAGQLTVLMGKPGIEWVLAGVLIGAGGILFSGLAGWLKDRDLRAAGTGAEFNLAKGLTLCVLAGILSAVFGLSLAAGQPIANVAARHGAGQFEGNVIYIFSCGGAYLSSALYCVWLHLRHRTAGEFVELPAGPERSALPVNFAMAVLTGFLWYGQFFFYGLGHVRMGSYQFTSWAIHMIMLVLFSSLAGVMLREWLGCRPRTVAALSTAIAILIAAVVILTYGNSLGDVPAAH